jgi:O-antigen/teichoic acid export membrane protein
VVWGDGERGGVAKEAATILASRMATRLLFRRATTAVGIYASVLLGFLATIVAARILGVEDFGLYAILIAATAFFQVLLDLTVEEAVTKYGFRYSTAEDWGRLRRLFARALAIKGAGAVVAAAALLVLAPFADRIFGASGLMVPLLVAAALPLVQASDGLAAVALILHGRYDIRALFLALAMGLRLIAIVVAAPAGLTAIMVGIVLAQALASGALAVAGWIAFRRFPRAEAVPLSEDSRALRRFVVQSTAATGVVSLRTALAPLLLGLVSTPAQVGLFRIALLPQQAFNTLSSPVRMILLTEQTRDWERGAHARVFEGVRRYSVGAAALMAVATVPLLVFMGDIVEALFGPDFGPGADAARVVLVAAVLQFVFGWTKSFPVTIGRPNLRVVTHGIETIVLLPLVLVLGMRWGATGAAVALLAGTVVFSVHWTVLFLRVRREPWPVGRTRESAAP